MAAPSKVQDGTAGQPLTFGGTIHLTGEGDTCRLRYVNEGGETVLDQRLSFLDVWGIRAVTGDLVTDRVRAVEL
jgi:hypothetical protein